MTTNYDPFEGAPAIKVGVLPEPATPTIKVGVLVHRAQHLTVEVLNVPTTGSFLLRFTHPGTGESVTFTDTPGGLRSLLAEADDAVIEAIDNLDL